MPEDKKEPEEMTKYGVACPCAKQDKPSELVKTASGYICPHCGKPYNNNSLTDSPK
jgi:hypothetical protein